MGDVLRLKSRAEARVEELEAQAGTRAAAAAAAEAERQQLAAAMAEAAAKLWDAEARVGELQGQLAEQREKAGGCFAELEAELAACRAKASEQLRMLEGRLAARWKEAEEVASLRQRLEQQVSGLLAGFPGSHLQPLNLMGMSPPMCCHEALEGGHISINSAIKNKQCP